MELEEFEQEETEVIEEDSNTKKRRFPKIPKKFLILFLRYSSCFLGER